MVRVLEIDFSTLFISLFVPFDATVIISTIYDENVKI